jgi:hypothetical protein
MSTLGAVADFVESAKPQWDVKPTLWVRPVGRDEWVCVAEYDDAYDAMFALITFGAREALLVTHAEMREVLPNDEVGAPMRCRTVLYATDGKLPDLVVYKMGDPVTSAHVRTLDSDDADAEGKLPQFIKHVWFVAQVLPTLGREDLLPTLLSGDDE